MHIDYCILTYTISAAHYRFFSDWLAKGRVGTCTRRPNVNGAAKNEPCLIDDAPLTCTQFRKPQEARGPPTHNSMRPRLLKDGRTNTNQKLDHCVQANVRAAPLSDSFELLVRFGRALGSTPAERCESFPVAATYIHAGVRCDS